MNRQISKLSYEEYYDSWKQLATSKPSAEKVSSFFDFIKKNFNQNGCAFLQGGLEQEIQRQLSEHNMLMYGQFKKDKKENLKANKVQLMKDIYDSKKRIKSKT